MRELLIATGNAGKRAEILEMLTGLPFSFLTLADVDAGEEPEENGTTLEENAVLKAKAYGVRTGKLALADDSGLEVDALDGRPGVASARYAPTQEERNERLLGELRNVPDDERGAAFRTVIAIYDPTRDIVKTCEGSARGCIAHAPRGTGGFGYDPIFDYGCKGKTGGELSAAEKQAISHRARALTRAREILRSMVEV